MNLITKEIQIWSCDMSISFYITITRLCIILQFFIAVKAINFRSKIVIFFLFLLKTYIVGTHSNGSNEYPQSIFRAKIRKLYIYDGTFEIRGS